MFKQIARPPFCRHWWGRAMTTSRRMDNASPQYPFNGESWDHHRKGGHGSPLHPPPQPGIWATSGLSRMCGDWAGSGEHIFKQRAHLPFCRHWWGRAMTTSWCMANASPKYPFNGEPCYHRHTGGVESPPHAHAPFSKMTKGFCPRPETAKVVMNCCGKGETCQCREIPFRPFNSDLVIAASAWLCGCGKRGG